MSTLKDIVAKFEAPFGCYEDSNCYDVETYIEGKFIVICPVTKFQDILWLQVEFVCNDKGQFVEYNSFNQWLVSLKKEELGLEGSCNLIYESIEKICTPNKLTVTVEAGYRIINQKAIRSSTHKFLAKG